MRRWVWFGLVWFGSGSGSSRCRAWLAAVRRRAVRCGAVRCGACCGCISRGEMRQVGGLVPGRAAQVPKQKAPLAFGACAFNGLQALSGVQVRRGQKEMRFVIGLFPIARGHTFKCHRIPQEEVRRRRAFGGCSIFRYLSRQSRTRHKAEPLKGDSIDCHCKLDRPGGRLVTRPSVYAPPSIRPRHPW